MRFLFRGDLLSAAPCAFPSALAFPLRTRRTEQRQSMSPPSITHFINSTICGGTYVTGSASYFQMRSFQAKASLRGAIFRPCQAGHLVAQQYFRFRVSRRKGRAFTDVAILCNEYAQKLEGCVEIALFPKTAEIQLLLTMPPSFLRSMI